MNVNVPDTSEKNYPDHLTPETAADYLHASTQTAQKTSPAQEKEEKEAPAGVLTRDRAEEDTPEARTQNLRRRGFLSEAFAWPVILGSFFHLHMMPKANTGKGPGRVIDHGHYIEVPANAQPGHLQQAAQLALQKGWTSVVMHEKNGKLHPSSPALQQFAPPGLKVCCDSKTAGSFYSNCRHAIVQHHFNKVAARDAVPAQMPLGPTPT